MKKWFTITLILLFSSAVIFFKLNQIPQNISFDEIEFSRLAIPLGNSTYIPYSTMATGHSTFYFYIILLSFKLFGLSNFALRLPSALFGISSILIFFFLIKNLLNKNEHIILAYLAVFILITSRWFINFARFSFEATFLLFLELTSLLFIIHYFKNKKSLFLGLSGIFAGLSFLSYTPGRLFFLLPLILVFIKKVNTKKIFIFVIPFLVISAPLIFYLIVQNDIRIDKVSMFYQDIPISSKLIMISENAQKTALMFNISGDMNGRHNFPGKPALNPILGIFFIVGLILSARNIHEFRNKLFLFYFLLSISPTLLTLPLDNPNMLRTFTVLPSVIYFIVYGITKITSYNFKVNKNIILSAIMGLVLISSFYELRTYFIFQNRVFRNSFEVKCPIEEVIDKIPKRCLVSRNEF